MNVEKDSIFPTTPMTLLRLLREADDDEWRQFYDLYGPVVYRMAKAARLSDEDAEDVLATVMRRFVQAVQGGFEPQPRPARFRNYLRTITNREIGRHVKQLVRHRHQRLTEADAAAHVCDGSQNGWTEVERQEYLGLCLDRLRASPAIRRRDFEAFERFALKGEPARTVARHFGYTETGLYQLKHRFIKQLRAIRERIERDLSEMS